MVKKWTVIGALLLGLVTFAGCGRFGDRAASPGTGADGGTTVEATGPEEAVLAAMGFDLAQVAVEPSAEPTAGPGTAPGKEGRPGKQQRRPLKVFLRRNVLHGEVVVQTKEGPQTVAVQRGTVTAIDDKSITVKSSDGFTATWTFGDPLHVLEHRNTIKPDEVKVGADVGVAGPKGTARLIVIR